MGEEAFVNAISENNIQFENKTFMFPWKHQQE